jgi:putative ABC transport system substrate-binding protein
MTPSGLRKHSGGAAAAWPLAARAQAPMPVIGYLSGRSPVTDVPMLSAFRQGLSDTGYVEGRNVAIEFRWAEGRYDRLPELVHDLVRRKVAVIVTSGGESTAQAAKAATSTTPIVFNVGGDPVEVGLVASFSRPGGNLTGVSSISATLMPKQFGLLSELAPKAVLIGVLVNPENLGVMAEARIAEIMSAARTVGRQAIILKASTDVDIDVAFETFIQRRVHALCVTSGPLFVTRTDSSSPSPLVTHSPPCTSVASWSMPGASSATRRARPRVIARWASTRGAS